MLDLNFEFLVKGFWLRLGPIGAIQLTKADLGSPRIESLLTTFPAMRHPMFCQSARSAGDAGSQLAVVIPRAFQCHSSSNT